MFNAIAEPRRRRIIGVLARGGETVPGVGSLGGAAGRGWPVGELAARLGMPQPMVSKHLGVLRQVGIVWVEKRGQQRLYGLNAGELKPVYDWVKEFERYWSGQLDRIKARAERKAAERSRAAGGHIEPHKEKKP